MYMNQQGGLRVNEQNMLEFTSTGYTWLSKESYEDSRITLSFSTVKEEIVLIPKYLSDTNYLYIAMNNEGKVSVGATIKDQEKVYVVLDAQPYLSAPATEGQTTNELELTSVGSRFTLKINGVTIHKFESSVFVRGQILLHGMAGEEFYSCTLEEPQSSSWQSNVIEGQSEVKIVQDDSNVNFFKLKGTDLFPASIQQSREISEGKYTLSFTAYGKGKVLLLGENDEVLSELNLQQDATDRVHFDYTASQTMRLTIKFESSANLYVGKIQLEKGSLTPYIPNGSNTENAQRVNTTLAYPIKDQFPVIAGSLYIHVTPPKDFDETTVVQEPQLIFRTDDNQLRLLYQKEVFSFWMGPKSVEINHSLSSNGEAVLLATWSDTEMKLSIGEETSERKDCMELANTISKLIFAEEESVKTPLILEEWALFPTVLQDIETIREQLPSALMHSLFDGGVSGVNVTWSEIPVAPIDHSPILVEKENGDPLQKVSFFDYETGKYQTMNREPITYDGRADYLEVSYNNLDEEYRDIAIRTEEGEIIGKPYRIVGKRIYFSLSEANRRMLKNKTLYVTYQVNDTYTIDYNIEALDGYRIDFAKHDGSKRIVYQEGNRYAELKKLATMIDLNPIQNQNHEGFLYITKNVNPTDTFRITSTPDRLHADGGSFATLIVEPLDYQGNFISHSELDVVADRGFVTRHINKDAVEAQKRSGQYLYQYYAPYIQAKVDGELEEDYIWITDRESGIGVCHKILLRPVKEPIVKPLTNDEKTKMEQKSQIIDYLLMYEDTEAYEDSELLSILDLNEDGRITMEEVSLLESSAKDNELIIILNKLEEWEAKQDEATTA